ncbi:hypothetical protein ACH4SK_08455 [Streptomyces inhibens]|uniref:hypothetical protein n=1 Tax=Streptomyces inhibens TaxID=2293571 RepID=UPI00379C7488
MRAKAVERELISGHLFWVIEIQATTAHLDIDHGHGVERVPFIVPARRRPGPYATDIPIDGRGTAMIRPCLLTHEQRQEQQQRQRRRALRAPACGMEVAR